MAHGYTRDYDDDFDRGSDDGGDRERGWNERGRERGFMFEGRENERDVRPRGGRRSFSSHPDDHYLSWRDKQLQALDREYQDYCREREQRFHSEFDQWRQQRRSNNPPLQAGMTQTGPSHDTDGELQLTDEARGMEADPDPMADATLGAESSGRGRR